jgi:hypothetical protein
MAEENPQDRRRFARMNTGPDYGVRIVHGGRVLERARLTSISGSGCAAQVQLEEIPGLEVGTLFDTIHLLHPDLPYVPLQGTAVWVMGRHATKTTGTVLLGIDFTPITPFLQQFMDAHVVAHT